MIHIMGDKSTSIDGAGKKLFSIKQPGRTRESGPGQSPVGVLFVDVDGPLHTIDFGVQRLFESFVGERFASTREAGFAYQKWEKRHQRTVGQVLDLDPSAHKEQVFMDLLFSAGVPGGPLEGLSPTHIAKAATRVFFPGFLESVKRQGLHTYEATEGRGCIVVALNSCGYRPVLQAALGGLRDDPDLRRSPGLHLLVNANKTHANDPLRLSGALVNPQRKGEWLSQVHRSLVEHFGMPEENVGAWGDGATDDWMLVATVLAGGQGHIVDIFKEGREQATKEAVLKGLRNALPNVNDNYIDELFAQGIDVVVGNDWTSGTGGHPSLLDPRGRRTIGESFEHDATKFVSAWQMRQLARSTDVTQVADLNSAASGRDLGIAV